MRSERGLSTILHCLQWYKLVLRTTRLSTAAVQYPIRKATVGGLHHLLSCQLSTTAVCSFEAPENIKSVV